MNPFGQVEMGAWVKNHEPMTSLIARTEPEANRFGRNVVKFSRQLLRTIYAGESLRALLNQPTPDYKIYGSQRWHDLHIMLLVKKGDKEDEPGRPRNPTFFGIVVQKSADEEHEEKWIRVEHMSGQGDEGLDVVGDEQNWKAIKLF